ncbi:hypothetical protein R5R35_007642 [Gryllus longicercus]|uniref:Ribosomal RNA processing protein 1 homolog n=1 Tax=Gryllus longicercus TaxID=2509291 RepID=A0AAN9VJU0_9ORTH
MEPKSNLKTREKAVFVAQQLHFANTLAGNDPTHRARAMKKLRKYFIARANGNFSFTHDDFMRIWKGLFYCMWMSDKPLIQEELAEEISQLVHCFQHVDTALTFVQAFFDTLLVEWFGIDYHRLDKFQMFVRRFLRQSLEYCRNKGWKKVPVSGLCDVFESTILSPSKCANECGDISLIMHFSDIFLEELAKVGRGKLSKEIIFIFLRPFMTHLAGQNDSRLLDVIRDRVFYCLIRQSPEGLEYEEKFEAWKRAGFPGTSWKDMVFVGKEDKRSGVKIKDLDPRAGKVNVYLPHLQFNAKSVADALRESSKTTLNKRTQKYINNIAHKFQQLAEGRYPLALNLSKSLLDSNKYRFSKQKIDDAVENLLNFEEKLKKEDKDVKNNGKRKKNSSKSTKSKKIKLENSCALEVDDTREDSDNSENEISSDDEDDDDEISSDDDEESIYSSDIPPALNIQTEESDLGLLQNSEAGNDENIISATDAKEQTNYEIDDKGTHGSEAENSFLTKITKKDKKMNNVSSWNVSETSRLHEKSAGIFQENKDCEKDNVLANDLNGEIQRKMKKPCFEVPSLENELQDTNVVEAVGETNVSVNVLPEDMEPQDTFDNEEANDLQEGDENESKDACEEETDDQAKEIVTPVRRSTRRRSNMATTSNKVNQEEGVITSECQLSNENEQTPLPKRKSLTPRSMIRAKRRISTVPDREILNEQETSVSSDSVNDITTNVPDSTGPIPKNENFSGVLRNNDMLNKQGPSPSRKVFQTPGKKRVSLNSTPASTKKVNIALQMNKSQAVSEYTAALKLSPSIPFDANKMPCKGVLKRTSMRSPINPFYIELILFCFLLEHVLPYNATANISVFCAFSILLFFDITLPRGYI